MPIREFVESAVKRMRSVPGTGPGGENITESPEGLSPLEKKNFIEKTH